MWSFNSSIQSLSKSDGVYIYSLKIRLRRFLYTEDFFDQLLLRKQPQCYTPIAKVTLGQAKI